MHPADEYAARVAEREKRITELETKDARLANIRLAIFAAAVGVAWWALAASDVSIAWMLVPVAAFITVALYHEQVKRRQIQLQRAVNFYRAGIARIEDRWSGQGSRGERFDDPHHVYAADLDLFGADSLFQLVSTARTRMGEDTLAKWLLAPADIDVVRERQACIAEVRGQLDLREDIALLGESDAVGLQPRALIEWAEKPRLWRPPWLKAAALVLPILAIAFACVWAIWGLISPFALVIVLELLLVRVIRKELQEAVSTTEVAFENLRLLEAVARRLEQARFESTLLRALQDRLLAHRPASESIAKLATIVQLLESRRNPFLALLQVPLLYTVNLAQAAEGWRAAHGASVRNWLDAIGQIEALLALASYSYEHPDDPFPEFVEGPARFEAEAIGHPLLPSARCVRNDVTIGANAAVLLVSGSNMSGKSTLLRTIGVNTVLAMAGAPVRARTLRLSPLQVGASIRVNDSLHEGASRFYAEITRLRQIHELSGRRPLLLFLFDELLQGTNSHDRRIGAQGIVSALIDRGAIGLVSTHDLALTEIDSTRGNRLRNMHFQDELRDGRMSFDYTLRDGVVAKSNALELMRSIGLEV